MPHIAHPTLIRPFDLAATPRRRIVIMGVSGAGKTVVGQRLAQELSYLFRDGDDLHPEANVAKMRAGTPLTDNDRWSWLELVANSLRRDAPVIIACSALRHIYRQHIITGVGGEVTFVYLAGTRDVIAQRIAMRKHPFMPAQLLDSQFQTLEPPTPDEAITVPVTMALPDQIALITAALAKA